LELYSIALYVIIVLNISLDSQYRIFTGILQRKFDFEVEM
jgi:hypothetical protein